MAISNYSAGLVRSYCLHTLGGGGQTTEEINSGVYDRWKDDINAGLKRLGVSTVYEALVHWERCGVITRKSELHSQDGKLKYRKVWRLGDGTPKETRVINPAIIEETKREIRRGLEPRNFTTFEGVRTFSGVVSGKALKKALEEMIEDGEIITEDVDLSRSRTLHLYKIVKRKGR